MIIAGPVVNISVWIVIGLNATVFYNVAGASDDTLSIQKLKQVWWFQTTSTIAICVAAAVSYLLLSRGSRQWLNVIARRIEEADSLSSRANAPAETGRGGGADE
jgi:hypothetical protein